MSKQAWVTPNDPPGETVCFKVVVPGGEEYEAAFRGALLSLTEAENWEKVQGEEIDDVTIAFLDTFNSVLERRVCMPVGSILFYAADAVPEGFLVCDGASYDREQYRILFDVIGYAFGGADDSFNVPDLQERFALGSSQSVSVSDTGGLAAVTLTVEQLAEHDHPLDATIIPVTPSGTTPIYGFNLFPTLATNERGDNEPHENMPPYLALLPVIAYR